MQTGARLMDLGKYLSIVWGLNTSSQKAGQILHLLGFLRNKVPFWKSVFVVTCIKSSFVKRCLRNMLLDSTLNGTSLPCRFVMIFNPLNPKLNPICYLLALLGVHHFLHISRIRVKLLTFRLLMSYIWSTHS